MRCDLLQRKPLALPALLGVLLTLAGCGSSGPGGVSVDALQTNVIFGAEQPARKAVAFGANVAPAPAHPATPVAPFPIPDTFTFFGNNTVPVLPLGGLCPAAPENTFPAEPASSNVPQLPAAGMSRWTASGTYDLSAGGIAIQLPVLPQYQQVVRHVQRFTDDFPQAGGGQQGLDYTFETVQPQFGNAHPGAYLQFVWQVKSNPATGDPEGGLALVEIDSLDALGKPASVIFKAAPHDGLLLLPLPAAPGPVEPSAISTLPTLPLPTGVQPPSSTQSIDVSGNGNNLQFTGNVGAPERLDACGTWLQAWPVDGTLTTNGASSASIHLDVLTQNGALVAAFNVDGSFLGTTYHKVKTHIGQATAPAPLTAPWQ